MRQTCCRFWQGSPAALLGYRILSKSGLTPSPQELYSSEDRCRRTFALLIPVMDTISSTSIPEALILNTISLSRSWMPSLRPSSIF